MLSGATELTLLLAALFDELELLEDLLDKLLDELLNTLERLDD